MNSYQWKKLLYFCQYPRYMMSHIIFSLKIFCCSASECAVITQHEQAGRPQNVYSTFLSCNFSWGRNCKSISWNNGALEAAAGIHSSRWIQFLLDKYRSSWKKMTRWAQRFIHLPVMPLHLMAPWWMWPVLQSNSWAVSEEGKKSRKNLDADCDLPGRCPAGCRRNEWYIRLILRQGGPTSSNK